MPPQLNNVTCIYRNLKSQNWELTGISYSIHNMKRLYEASRDFQFYLGESEGTLYFDDSKLIVIYSVSLSLEFVM